MRKTFTRSVAAVLAAATIATSFTLTQANAASVAAKPAPVTSDFSARSRGAGATVAFGAMALIAGAAIAASHRRDYDDCGPYGCGYAYAPGPYYYGYGPGYYGGYRHWHHRHWR